MAQAVQFDAKTVVDELIASGAVVMIAKSWCGYCKKAFAILSKYTKDIVRKDIDKDFSEDEMAAIQAYYKTLTGASSVPRVFIGGKFIGGCDDTTGLDQAGKLKPLIEAALKQ
eukprot:392114_1